MSPQKAEWEPPGIVECRFEHVPFGSSIGVRAWRWWGSLRVCRRADDLCGATSSQDAANQRRSTWLPTTRPFSDSLTPTMTPSVLICHLLGVEAVSVSYNGLVPGVVAESADVEVVPRLGSAGGQIDLCAWDDILDRAMTSALVVARPEETLYVRCLSESVRWRSAIARAASFRDCSFPEEAAAAPRLCRKCQIGRAHV